MAQKFPPELTEYIREIAKGRRINEITMLVNEKFMQNLSKAQVKGIMQRNRICNGLFHSHAPYYSNKFPKDVTEYIKNNYPGVGPTEMAKRLSEKFGREYTYSQVRNYYSRKGYKSGLTGRFEKGFTPATKGKKWDDFMSIKAQERSRKTCYKKGHIPENHVHVGSVTKRPQRTNKKGEKVTTYVLYIKISEPNVWIPLHKLNYIAEHGEVPKDHVIVFADRNTLNPDPDNLIAVPKSVMAQLNRHLPSWNTKEELEMLILLAKNKQILSGIKKQNQSHREEYWKSIPGYSGKYQASTEGNIKRIYKNGKERILTPFVRKSTGKDDLYVKVSKNGKHKDTKISVLIYRTWVSDIFEDMNIVHLDGDKKNCKPGNLRAVTKKALGKNFGYMARNKEVVKLSEAGDIIEEYRSAREAAKHNGVSYQTIMDRCNGVIKKKLLINGCYFAWKQNAC